MTDFHETHYERYGVGPTGQLFQIGSCLKIPTAL